MSILFPRPFAIAIDDLGWIKGQDDGQNGYGPYRTGLSRNMTLADYKAVVDLAKRAGVRLQGLFILGEMDRENFLGEFPTTTYQRSKWDNSENISDLQEEMMEYVKHVSSHLEFGLHGVGHEYWPEDGKRRRAEWYNTEDNHPWPEEEVRNHLKCFVQIMNQYGISPDNGHSFPESFVPCAYSYYWNPDGEYSLGSVLGEFGVRFANTDFTRIPECNPPKEANGGGFDHSVHVMNRYNYGNLWCAPGKLPETPLTEQPTDYIETHWPNLLFSETESQEDITAKWVAYYETVQSSPDRYCAKNTAQMHSQWLYNKYTQLSTKPEGIELDNTDMPDRVYQGHFPSNLVLKIKLNDGEHLSSASINEEPIAAYFEDQGYGFIYLPPLLQKKYILKYKLGSELITEMVWHNTTSNILEVSHKENETKIDLCWYGDQKLTLLTNKEPEELESNNPGITIKGWEKESDRIIIRLIAKDMQGEIGSIKVKY